MSWSLRIRLSLMMFLQYAIWGAWAPVLWPQLKALGFSDPQAAWVFGALWLACIVAPFIGGQIVDRWFPTQWFLAAVHLVGGVLLILNAREKEFGPFMTLMTIYSLLYAPTLALTNSLAFHHMKDAEREFGIIRVFGTLGWIAAGVALTVWRKEMTQPISADMLYLAGGFSIAMGISCCFLPHTPPRKEAENPWAFMEALQLLKNKNFAIFMAIAFVVTTELQFYYLPTAEFLENAVGIAQANVPAVMTTAQIAEIVAMAVLLPILLPVIGIRKALAIGVIAWPLRYIIFALYQSVPYQVVVASLTLHGIGYTFFFVVSQIYVNKVAPADIRASAQALLTLITLGIGSFLGTQFTGWIMALLSKTQVVVAEAGGPAREVLVRDWTWVFLVPCFLTGACAIAFLIWFKEPKEEGGEAKPGA
jgi:nucleoside transporter